MLDEPKYWISLILGLCVVALSGIPLLNGWGLIGFGLPGFLNLSGNILLWVIAVIGVYLLVDSFLNEMSETVMWTSVGVAVIILAIAIIQILGGMGIIPFVIPGISLTILQILFFIEGIGMIIAGFGDK